MALHGGQEFPCRQNALWSDQAFDLEQQGKECREIDGCERAQKDPARHKSVAGASLRIEEPSKAAPNEVARWCSVRVDV